MVGGEGGDVEHHVVIAGIVAGDAGEGLGVVLAGLIHALYDFASLLFVNVLFSHDAFHAGFGVGDEEQTHGVGVVFEDVEAGTPHDDAGLLFGNFLQEFFFLLVELHRIDLKRFVGDGGGGAELFVESAEVGPPVPFRGFDLLNILVGEVVFFHNGGEDFLAIDFDTEQFAQFFGDFLSAGTRFAVDGDDEVGVFHIIFCYFQMSGQKYNFSGFKFKFQVSSFRFQVSGFETRKNITFAA